MRNMKAEVAGNSKVEEVKKKVSELAKSEKAKIEANYHRMKPEEMDEVMSRAKPSSRAIRYEVRMGSAKSKTEPS